MFLFLLLVNLFITAESADKRILLTKEDASYAMSGFQFLNYDRIIVENEANPLGFIFVQAARSINNGPIPQAWIVDQYGNHSAIDPTTAPIYYGPNLTMQLGADRNWNFGITFERTDITNRSEPFNRENGLLILNEDTGGGINWASEIPVSVTFISMESSSKPTIACQSEFILTENCQVDMFSGGVPSEEGKEKYRLFSFTNQTISLFKTSVIYSTAVTFLIPANCSARSSCTVQKWIENTTIDTNSIGFFVSSEYPGVFDTEKTGINSWIKSYQLNGYSNISFEIVSLDPGVTGNLSIFAGDQWTTYSQSTKGVTLEGSGRNIVVDWSPSIDTKKGFLMRYKTIPSDDPNPPTTEETTHQSSPSSEPPIETTTKMCSDHLIFTSFSFILSYLLL